MPKADRRFYEPLVLLDALDRSQGERIPEERYESMDSSDCASARQRRVVLDFLCKMCDHKKGGETVTAMALQSTPGGPVYWISSSEDVRKKILPFLQQTLKMLEAGSKQCPETLNSNLEDQLFLKFTAFSEHRLKETLHLLQSSIKRQDKRRSAENESSVNWEGKKELLDLTACTYRLTCISLPKVVGAIQKQIQRKRTATAAVSVCSFSKKLFLHACQVYRTGSQVIRCKE